MKWSCSCWSKDSQVHGSTFSINSGTPSMSWWWRRRKWWEQNFAIWFSCAVDLKCSTSTWKHLVRDDKEKRTREKVKENLYWSKEMMYLLYLKQQDGMKRKDWSETGRWLEGFTSVSLEMMMMWDSWVFRTGRHEWILTPPDFLPPSLTG